MPSEAELYASTALKRAVDHLRSRPGGWEDHFREMVDRSDHGMVLLSTDGRVLEANVAACASMGTARADAIGRAVWTVRGWSTAPVGEQLRSALAAAQRDTLVRCEVDIPGTSETTSLDTTFTPIIAGNGEVALVLLEWRDVTARKAAERALRESEERIHRIISIAVDAIISMDDAQCITLFNQGAEKIFGYTAGEVIGRPLNLLLPPELAAIHTKEVRAFGESEHIARRMGERRPILGRRKNGEIFNADASISKATINGRHVYTAVLQDVTARVLADKEKSELLTAAQHARDVAERAARP